MSGLLERFWYPVVPERWPRRVLLAPLELISLAWRLAVSTHRSVAGRRPLRPRARVVSVGGLTVGGAGKTPAVIFLAQWASARGARVLVLSRGHGRVSSSELELPPGGGAVKAEDAGDEPLLIARRCPGATVWVGTDRARLAQRASESLRPDLILLDDGFQHWGLGRDEDLVVVNGMRGFGNGRLLPRGPLREPLTALSRATWLWVREAPEVPEALPALPKLLTRHRPSVLIGEERGEEPAATLKGMRVLAFAGLARPRGFFESLQELGAEVVLARPYGDHHRYRASELNWLQERARGFGASLITTEKDAVRLPREFPARALRLEVEIHGGEETLPTKLLGRGA